MFRELTELDGAYQVPRHISSISCRRLLGELIAQIEQVTGDKAASMRFDGCVGDDGVKDDSMGSFASDFSEPGDGHVFFQRGGVSGPRLG